jgi:exopolysaccharide biosynthesis polyprenyl glycosylphosphotransferase
VVVSCLVAVLGRGVLPLGSPTDVSDSVLRVAPTLIVLWLLAHAASGAYRAEVFGAGTDEFKRVLSAAVYTAGLLGVGCYLFKYPLSRGFFLLAFLVGVPALICGRTLLRRALRSAREHDALCQRVIIAGGPAHVDEIAAVLGRERWLGYRVIGALVPSAYPGSETGSGIPVLGCCDDGDAVVAAGAEADVIFLTGGAAMAAGDLRQIAWDLEQEHVQLVVAPSITDISADRVRIRPVGGLPLVHLEAPRWAQASRWAKRSFDMIGSALLIIAAAPVILFAAAQIKLHDGGPVFFRQTRVGKDGEAFGCFKFRTMVVDAEAMVARLQQEQGVEALLFKMKDDPRITKPGRWLRRFSIDELPQLFNVLLGDMSLVGPRPQVPREVAMYDDVMSRRLRVRPGMTGLWQVSGRNDLSVQDSIRLDLYYVDNWSMFQDLSILARTFGAVVGSRGAY